MIPDNRPLDRRSTPTVRIGKVPVGGAHPIVVQSMTNTDTEDAGSTARQVAELARAGSELVRITARSTPSRPLPGFRRSASDWH